MARTRGATTLGVAVEVPVQGTDATPLYAQVYHRLRDHILAGTLRPGARLPSARALAADLRVSRNTIEAAFQQLAAEGFITRRVGAGTVVAASMEEHVPFARAPRRAQPPGPARPAQQVPIPLSKRGRLISDLGRAEIQADHPIGPCAADLIGFPTRLWYRLLARRARQGGAELFRAGDHYGMPPLRAAIAEHVRLTRGVRCEAEQVLVVNSTQQAIDLAARLLLDPGGTALVEEPGYPSARAAFLAAGATVRTIPVDAEGVVAEELPKGPATRLLYVTPSHQFPLGVTMTLARRLAVLGWAAESGAWVIEDDYDSEFRYQGRPIAALQGLDQAGRVLYVGTCNKVLFPGLRLAYLIVPAGLVDAFAAGRRITDGFSSPLMQSVLADFLAGGHFAAYLRQARDHYAACRDALVRSAETTWGGVVRLGPSDTGLHLLTYLPAGTHDVRLAAAAPTEGLGVAALSRYYYDRARSRGLLLSYGATTPERVRHAVVALAPLLTPPGGSLPRRKVAP
jgi:GntR family transcriptional regulator/MocR family aminotransferase